MTAERAVMQNMTVDNWLTLIEQLVSAQGWEVTSKKLIRQKARGPCPLCALANSVLKLPSETNPGWHTSWNIALVRAFGQLDPKSLTSANTIAGAADDRLGTVPIIVIRIRLGEILHIPRETL